MADAIASLAAQEDAPPPEEPATIDPSTLTEEERKALKAKMKAEKRKAKEEEEKKKRNIIVSTDASSPYGHFASDTNRRPKVSGYDTADYVQYEEYRFYDPVVNDPQRHGEGFGAYTTFRVIVKSSDPEFAPEINIRLRYSHFHTLREALVESHPNMLVPEMPPKKMFGKFDPDFLNERARGLEKFLDLVISHAVFGKSPHLIKMFKTPSA